MKNKILKTFLFFVLFSALLITASFAVEIKEDVADYESDVYIIGSTRFDANQTITADMAANAGLNEAKVQVALGNNISNLKVTIYFYDAIFGDWYEINKSAKADLIEDTTKIENIEDNLNIFYEEGVEKTLEVKYEGDVDKTSLPSNVKYDEEKGVFVVPATTFNFTFEDSNGVETKVDTNVDTNLKIENEENHEKVEIKRNPEVKFELAKEIVAGEATEFTVSTIANDYAGVMVVGTGSVNPDNVLKLEYAVGDQWVDMTGESLFGNEGAGFPLQDATSKFKVTFDKAGEYDVTFAIKNLETGKIMADVATKTNVTTTKNVNTLAELETALLNKYITNINILSDIETDHSILVGRKVIINGNNKTISFKEMPKEWVEGKNNYVLKVYNTEATISDIKLTNSLAGLWVGSSNVTLTGTIDVTGNKMGGIDVSKSSNEGMPNSILTVNGTIKRDDEAINRPLIWVENEQGVLADGNKLFVANTNIPTACALNQTYYYSSADVYKNVEVATTEELETAMLLSDVENITLLNNIELSNELIINRNLTLNLNAYTLTGKGDEVLMVNGDNCEVTVKNGNIVCKGSASVVIGEKNKYTGEKAVLNIEKDVTVTTDKFGVYVVGPNTVANIYGKVIVPEGANANGWAVGGNGNPENAGTTINIYKGSLIESKVGLAVYLPQEGVTNIDGTVKGHSGIATKAGTLNVNESAKIMATGASISNEELAANNSGISASGDIIFVECHDGYADNVHINIKAELEKDTDSNIIRVFKPSNVTKDVKEIKGVYTTAHVENINGALVTTYNQDEATIKVGNTNYAEDSLDYALNLFATGKQQQAMLLDNITTTEIIQIISETPINLTLDLNGKKLTTTSDVALNLKSANSSLKIVNNAEPKGIIEGTECSGLGINVINVKDSISTLEIGKNVEVIGKKYGIELFAKNKEDSIAALKVYGTVKSVDGFAISGNGKYDGADIYIYDGANIISENDTAIYLPQYGTTTINGGTITGKTAIGIKSGNLYINGGTFTATGEKVSLPSATYNGMDPTGDVIFVEANASYPEGTQIYVNGGSFEFGANVITRGEILRILKEKNDSQEPSIYGIEPVIVVDE